MKNKKLCPVVWLHGLFGWGNDEMMHMPYFGLSSAGFKYQRYLSGDFARKSFFPKIGSVSSSWDRACEAFYQLKGGDVWYGEDHSRCHGHAMAIKNWPFGRKPLYPEWSSENPIHLVGHSQGAQTARMLQYLLSLKDFFIDPRTGRSFDTNENWVKSVTSVAGVLNGATSAYVMGCSPEYGMLNQYSMGMALAKSMYWVDVDRRMPWRALSRLYSISATQFYSRVGEMLYGMDNAAFDLCLHGAQLQAEFLRDFPSTYYFSFPCQSTTETQLGFHVATPDTAPVLRHFSDEVGRFKMPLKLREPITDYSAWWPNDGMVPIISQRYPFGSQYTEVGPETEIIPGRWHVMPKTKIDHLGIVMLPSFGWKQFQFYRNLYTTLSQIEKEELKDAA